MNARPAKALAEVPISVRTKLSALWAALMLLYIYADILGFYTPGTIEKVVSGEIGAVQITEGFLLIMAVWMAIPSVMVFLSLALKARASRLANIIVGLLSAVALGATFFAGELSLRYGFHAAVEGALIALIVWHAWTWPSRDSGELRLSS